jgi:hypothetical protein
MQKTQKSKLRVVEGPVTLVGSIARAVQLPDGSARVETWGGIKNGWEPGGTDFFEIHFAPPASAQRLAQFGIPEDEWPEELRRLGLRIFGIIEPTSMKRIVQPRNSLDWTLIPAKTSRAPLERELKALFRGLSPVQVDSVRLKSRTRLEEKIVGTRLPDTVGDYLAGRILVDNSLYLDETVKLICRRYTNVEHNETMDRAGCRGYRACHLQIVLDYGITAEIHIVPRDVYEVCKIEDPKYEKWRKKTILTPDEVRVLRIEDARINEIYDLAYQQWLERARPRYYLSQRIRRFFSRRKDSRSAELESRVVRIPTNLVGALARIVELSDGTGKTETWGVTGWEAGGADVAEILRALPASAEHLSEYGVPKIDWPAHL